jgi:hypothetical protein
MSDDSLEERRRRVAADRLTLEEEELQIKRLKLQKERAAVEQQTAIVRLNVGGQPFDTTKSTLLGAKSSFFHRLLDSEDGLVPGAELDKDGRLFIDRSPEGFRLLLEWLRGTCEPSTLDAASHELLLKESLYYDVPMLLRELSGGYDPSTLSEDDQLIRDEAQAIRLALVERRPNAVSEADANLIDVFSRTGSLDALTYTGLPTSPGVPCLFTAEARRTGRTEGTTLSCRSIEGFRARLNLFAGPLSIFEGLDMTNLIVAGGAVLQALLLSNPNPPGEREQQRARKKAQAGHSDIDLFVVAEEEASARAAFDRLVSHIKARLAERPVWPDDHTDGNDLGPHTELLVYRSRMAVTIYAGHPQRTVQVTLPLPTSRSLSSLLLACYF